MKRQWISLALLTVAMAFSASADNTTTLYEGYDLKLEQITDAMTDAKSCALFVQSGPIYLSVEGKSQVTVWPSSEALHFAPDEKHLIRVGTGTPVELSYIPKRNGLSVTNASEVVDALAKRQTLKLRVYDVLSGRPDDLTVEAPAFAYVWAIAEKQCGWPSLGVPAELPEAKLFVYEGDMVPGTASAHVETNRDLGLRRDSDKYGNGCYIEIGNNSTIGMQGGKWRSGHADIGGNEKITVRDAAGKVVLDVKAPEYALGSGMSTGILWPRGSDLARAMWSAAPHGTVTITGVSYPKENVPLYGFRELWKWGMQRCSFPSVE